MEKQGTEFELFVKKIYEEILVFDGYDTVRVEHDVNALGKRQGNCTKKGRDVPLPELIFTSLF
jgi:hypothetical protein